VIIKACIGCNFHEIRKEEEKMSYCKKECCWAQYSKCIQMKAMEKFLNEECLIPSTIST
jgi:hypothetical protein